MLLILDLTPKNSTLSSLQLLNLTELLNKVNAVLRIYNKPVQVTSGFRSLEDHLRIYAKKGITDQTKIPMKSKHLFGQAVDISDSKHTLQRFINENPELIEDNELWLENFKFTPNWVHFQSVAYASWDETKSRFFVP